jgi:hypothetical protein
MQCDQYQKEGKTDKRRVHLDENGDEFEASPNM